METRPNGFRRPVSRGELTSEEADRFENICPGRRVVRPTSAANNHPLWGPYESLHKGYSTDPEVRHQGSSGGVLTECLLYLLEDNLVDAVIQITASDDPPWGNKTIVSTTREEVLSSAGSRYAPSSPLDILTQLDLDKRYAFVGKPCDAGALRSLTRSDSKLKRAFPYILSFFCAGVPSSDGAKEILQKMGAKETATVKFRFRGNGWPGTTRALSKSGTATEMKYEEAWGEILTKHIQFRCKICPDGTGSAADLVAADGWETNREGYPIFEDLPGQSLVLSRTEEGKSLTKKLESAKKVKVAFLNIEQLYSIQPGQVSKATSNFSRTLALRMFGKRCPNYKNFNSKAAAKYAPLKSSVRNFLGIIRRTISGQIE